MIIKSFSLRVIVRAFDLIARLNTLIDNQRYTELDLVYKYILKSWRIYQIFILYIFIENFNKMSIFNKKENNNKKKEILKKVLLNITDLKIKIKILS